MDPAPLDIPAQDHAACPPGRALAWLDHAKTVIDRDYPLIAGSLEKNHDSFGDTWKHEFAKALLITCPDDDALGEALKGYSDFIVESMRLQLEFQHRKEYEAKPYSEVADEVYHNERYMMRLYLPGILLSHYLWPHEYRQLAFFRAAFLPEIARGADRRFHDVGLGTGFYSSVILSAIPQAHGIGWDLSQYSISYARQLLAAHGVLDRYEMRQQDILSAPETEPLGFLICIEVLEHLERPQEFLKGLNAMLLGNGKAFITAAVNAPNKDHIFLYRGCEDLLDQLNSAGFVIEQSFTGYAYPPRKHLPVVPSIAAAIVTK